MNVCSCVESSPSDKTPMFAACAAGEEHALTKYSLLWGQKRCPWLPDKVYYRQSSATLDEVHLQLQLQIWVCPNRHLAEGLGELFFK